MSGHTPGPWFLIPGQCGVYSEPLHRVTKVESDEGVVKDFHEGLVALLYGHFDADHNYSLDANHALVAAAPDLLAAVLELVELKDLKDRLDENSRRLAEDYEARKPKAWEAARAALRKAGVVL